MGSAPIQLGFSSGVMLEVSSGLENLVFKLAFALLDIRGRLVDCLLKTGQPIAALAIAVIELLAISVQLFFLSRQLFGLGLQLRLLAGETILFWLNDLAVLLERGSVGG